MNMKKTMAGIMAGAMAVSAMAATVSADQDTISLTYDLKTYKEIDSDNGRVTYVETYANATDGTAYMFKNNVSALTFGAGNVKKDNNGKSYLTEAMSGEITVKTSKYTADGSAAQSTGSLTLKFTKDGEFAKKNPDYLFRSDVFSGLNFSVPVTQSSQTGAIPASAYDLTTLGYSSDFAGYCGFDFVNVKVTYKIPAKVNVNAYNSWSGFNSAYGVLGINGTADKAIDLSADANGLNSNVTNAVDNFVDRNFQTVKPTATQYANLTAGETGEAIYPFKTVLQPAAGENDVIAAITSRKAGGNFYTKPVAVINDAIANNENVVFTFTSFNGDVATAKSHLFQEWVEADRAYGYQTSSYDWKNPTFGQHLYTNINNSYSLYGSDAYDMYGSYSSAWGVNLFTGAIVVNNGLTMQLSDTDKFNWGSNTLSFDWFTITDEGKITDAKTFLTSMMLYTPVDWYWDNLTIVVGNTEEDNVDAGEGLDGEGDVIEDEVDEVVDEIIEEVEVEEVVETEPEVVETEAAPVEAAPSPATGNAPVALAVIPVALAAAAVVAKKRG